MAEHNPPNPAVIRIALATLNYKLRQALLQGPPYADLTSFYNTVKRSKKWTNITRCKDAEIVKARHVSLVCTLIKEIQDHYKADAQGKPVAWATLLNKATWKGYISSAPTANAPTASPHAPAPAPAPGPAPTPPTNHAPALAAATIANPSQPVAPAPTLPTPRPVPYVLVPHSATSSIPWAATGPSIPRPPALKSGHGNNAPPAKTSHPLAPALSKPPQQHPKQVKGVPSFDEMLINLEPCERCVIQGMTCYRHMGKDGKEGACFNCNQKKVSCNLALKGKLKPQDQHSNKASQKGKQKVEACTSRAITWRNGSDRIGLDVYQVVSPVYVAELDDDHEVDDNDDDKLVEVAPPGRSFPRIPSRHHVGRLAQHQGPSNDPLLRTALSLSQCLVLSPSPPPYGGVQPNQGWYQQMVDYVSEVNAQNWDKQGRLDGLIKALTKHAHGDVIREDVNRRVANLEQLTQEGFARTGECLKAIWDHADATTRRVSKLEQRVTELEAVPSAPPMVPLPPSPIIFVSTESSPHPQSKDDAGTEGSIAEVSVSEDENDTEHESQSASDKPMDNLEDGKADAEDDNRDSDSEVRVSDAEDEPEAAPDGTASGGMESGGTASGGPASGGTISDGKATGEMATGGMASGGMASSGTASDGMRSSAAASGGSVSGVADKPVPKPIAETSVPDAPARPQEKVSEADVALAPATATAVAGGPSITIIGATPHASQEQGTQPGHLS
ncbi:hypothetical protein DXG01_000794 [Tephrocybe rancida]|nr:hypothetical protein DXG01_000794 [Tephrocybe rancida]